MQPQRPPRVAEPAPLADRLAGAGVGQRARASASAAARPRTPEGPARPGVCCSMNSLTRTAHARGAGAAPGQVARVGRVPAPDDDLQRLGKGAHYCDRRTARHRGPSRVRAYHAPMTSDSLLHPVGSLPPEVYWRRRALAGVLAVLVLWLAWCAFPGKNHANASPGPAKKPTTAATGSPQRDPDAGRHHHRPPAAAATTTPPRGRRRDLAGGGRRRRRAATTAGRAQVHRRRRSASRPTTPSTRRAPCRSSS